MTITLLLLALVSALAALRFHRLYRHTQAHTRHACHLLTDYSQEAHRQERLTSDYHQLTVRLYQRINELEARCYRLRRETAPPAENSPQPVYFVHTFTDKHGLDNHLVEWPN